MGAKLTRSSDLAETLHREMATFLATEPYEIITEFDVDARVYKYRAKPRCGVPILIRILTGEILYHLRSALDQLVWQAALLNPGPPASTTEFPVFIDAKAYASNRRRKIGSLPVAAQTIIDGLQPFLTASPDDDPLWVLHRLTNEDKHRLPQLVAAAPGQVSAQLNGRSGLVEVRTGPFDDQPIIGSVRLTDPAETNLEMKTTIEFTLAFPINGPGKGRLLFDQLNQCGQRVRKIIEALDGFFKSTELPK